MKGTTGENGRIATIALTNELLIYGTDSGTIEFFLLEDWATVNVYRHTTGIKYISPDTNGIKIAIIDDSNEVYIYNAVTDIPIQLTSPSDLPNNIHSILWESWPLDKGVFVLMDSKEMFVYCYITDTIDGPSVSYVGKMKIPPSQFPLLLYNGVIICQTRSGKTANFLLNTHDYGEFMQDRKKLKNEMLKNVLKLRRYQDAAKICEFLQDKGRLMFYYIMMNLKITFSV